jgi:hypothetical protein
MTVVVLNTGKAAVVDANIATLLWRIKNKEVKNASPRLIEKANKISRFLFGPASAPQSWKEQNARATVEDSKSDEELPPNMAWIHN